ncbi:UDP-N-acetylglucosamine-N-acetylmuramylpentapeptide N-acetylglucosamine transferase [Fodinibius salinus]|uniref:UDP-N-acetylglucosamine--N-acetylmuramyl-(pentapeptide) pyrophosphoryl-undecaprenol N-acetylglucosamine transferase n=1 Tax=Fodinibius salinus TaxID=860790 RepID=A0A5D3YIT0_9BACT|nr:undecaprenyldiphospho-muramoylpentapeptide beta-N-acetylglucosaminyltransferase [Fodinibius salinus]TYP92214.1 UDP-N-acetylglucosamine-N-acetylmuramylpentapeptide N-acetylglucosamine transferase [Fodinibius salinus]
MHSAAKDISYQHRGTASEQGTIKVLVAAGGTGGHVYPAIAIAEALQNEYGNTEILFVGTRNHLEWEAVPKAGFNITNIWISGFHRRLTLKNLLFPIKLVTSLMQSIGIVRRFDPDAVISCGGYAAGPTAWVANKMGVPLFIQEQNSFPGVTNRILGRSAERIFTAFKDADHYFPIDKTQIAGNPTRKSLTNADQQEALEEFSFGSDQKTLLVLGGSGGARSINEAMLDHIDQMHNQMELQIIWQCGERYFDQIRNQIHKKNYENLRLIDFLHNMPEAYAVADLVISRAGALSCSELALTGKPSILVPSPNVAGDHQRKNARSMVEEGAAELIQDKDLKNTLAGLVEKIITDQQKLAAMNKAAKKLSRPEAAETIATEILKLIKQKST